MSGYLNRAQLIGNLCQDPEVRIMQNGGKVVTLSIATTESWRDKHSGEGKTATEWHRVVIFAEGLADVAEKYLTRGAKVMVEGKLKTRRWTDNAGVERFSTEIQLQPYDGMLTFLDTKKRDGERTSSRDEPERKPAMANDGGSPWDAPRPATDLDNDIPF